jgi:hypothetical protein
MAYRLTLPPALAAGEEAGPLYAGLYIQKKPVTPVTAVSAGDSTPVPGARPVTPPVTPTSTPGPDRPPPASSPVPSVPPAPVPPRTWVRLNPATVREVLGARPDPHSLACIRFDVMLAMRQLEAEIASGVIEPRARLVAGRPLGDWLDLADVARLLRAWGERG